MDCTYAGVALWLAILNSEGFLVPKTSKHTMQCPAYTLAGEGFGLRGEDLGFHLRVQEVSWETIAIASIAVIYSYWGS